MNLSPEWVSEFQSIDIAAVHWSSAGKANARDELIMSWARENNHIVFTSDFDFGSMLALNRTSGRGVPQIRTSKLMPVDLLAMVKRIYESHATDLADGALIVAELRRWRMRILPLT